jgi:hypothetical protein
MLKYDELVELKEKLINGEITLEFANNLYWKDYKEGQRSWHTKDWKERRIKILKEKCEICESSDTLNIQHLSHPKKYSEHERETIKKYTQIIKEDFIFFDKLEFKEYIYKNYEYLAVPLCVNCGNNRPFKRLNKLPKFRCLTCKHEFDEPIFKSLEEILTIFYNDHESPFVREKCFISKDKYKNNQNLSSVKYWFQRELAKKKNENIIKKETFINYINDNIKYLSFEDTITACKKCASNYDLKNLELCPKCKLNYKGIQYPTCIQCLPDEKRKIVLEIIDFGKDWNSMHEDLGID